jgi:hypothetical protein
MRPAGKVAIISGAASGMGAPGRGRTTGRVVILRQGQNLPEVGLHQCPSERKGEGGPVRSLHVPSHVPSPPENAAKVRGFSRTASAFTAETDCLLEQSGFEPSVPPDRCRRHINPPHSKRERSSAKTSGKNGWSRPRKG